jgi:hypothetical protein
MDQQYKYVSYDQHDNQILKWVIDQQILDTNGEKQLS